MNANISLETSYGPTFQQFQEIFYRPHTNVLITSKIDTTRCVSAKNVILIEDYSAKVKVTSRITSYLISSSIA